MRLWSGLVPVIGEEREREREKADFVELTKENVRSVMGYVSEEGRAAPL